MRPSAIASDWRLQSMAIRRGLVNVPGGEADNERGKVRSAGVLANRSP